MCHFAVILTRFVTAAVNTLVSSSPCDCNPDGGELPRLIMRLVELGDALYCVNEALCGDERRVFDTAAPCCHHFICHMCLIT